MIIKKKKDLVTVLMSYLWQNTKYCDLILAFGDIFFNIVTTSMANVCDNWRIFDYGMQMK